MKNIYPLIWMVLVGVGVVIVAYAGFSIIDRVWLQRSRVRRRVEGIGGRGEKQEPEVRKPVITGDEALPTVAKILSSQGLTDRMLLMLMRAGIKMRPSEFVGIIFAIGLALALIGALVFGNIVAVAIGIIIGLAVPMFYVKALQARRLAMFNSQLPDALALISSAIRSGYSFQRAIEMTSSEMPDPISEEFGRVLDETSVGISLPDALTRMAARILSYDFELVVTAVIIQQSVGGNLAEVIDNIAGTIRERVRVEGELSALTADGRISGIVLILLPFALAAVIFIKDPNYLRPLLHETRGIIMAVSGVCMQIIGALIIRRMLVLDY